MRKFSRMLTPGLFVGASSNDEQGKYDPQMGDEFKKGPPGKKNVDLTYLNVTDRAIATDGTSNYYISSLNTGIDGLKKRSAESENRTNVHIKILNNRDVTRLTSPIQL